MSADLLRQVFDAARWALSGRNIQGWRIVAVAGEEREAVIRMTREIRPDPNGPFPIYPPNLWAPLRSRRFALPADTYRALEIPNEENLPRLQHVAQHFEFFGAPVRLFFVIDRRLTHGQWAHLGMLIQTVALLLEERGLGSCMQEA